jgi:hypothetical protein
MGGFFRNIAPYASVFQGQQQGQAASNYAQQEVEQRKIQDQLQRALLMGKLQDMQAQQKALSGLPADEQQFLNLPGGNVKDWTSRQERTTKASALADQMYQAAMDTSKPVQERMDLFQRAASLRVHPELIDLPENQKYGSGTTKPPTQPFRPFTADSTVQAFEGYGPDGKPIIQPLGAAKAPATSEDKFNDMPIGAVPGKTWLKPDGTPFEDPGMSVRDARAAGGVLLTDKDRDLLGQAQEASANLDGILETGEKVLPKSTEPGVGNLVLDPIKRSIRMRTDPTYAAYAHSLAGIIPYMRNLAGVGRVNQTEMDLIVSRLQNANTLPALQSAVTEANRIINNAKANLTKAGKFTTSGDSGNADKSIGWSPDGREVMQRSDGSKYLK